MHAACVGGGGGGVWPFAAAFNVVVGCVGFLVVLAVSVVVVFFDIWWPWHLLMFAVVICVYLDGVAYLSVWLCLLTQW